MDLTMDRNKSANSIIQSKSSFVRENYYRGGSFMRKFKQGVEAAGIRKFWLFSIPSLSILVMSFILTGFIPSLTKFQRKVGFLDHKGIFGMCGVVAILHFPALTRLFSRKWAAVMLIVNLFIDTFFVSMVTATAKIEKIPGLVIILLWILHVVILVIISSPKYYENTYSSVASFIALMYVVVAPVVTIVFDLRNVHISLAIISIGICMLCFLGTVEAIYHEVMPEKKFGIWDGVQEAYQFIGNFIFFAMMFYIIFSPMIFFVDQNADNDALSKMTDSINSHDLNQQQDFLGFNV